jgi:PAS domain S-box-containing protein
MNIYMINTLSPEQISLEMEKTKDHLKTYFEFKHRKADGSIADVEVYSSRIVIGGKEYLHFIVHDVTERKKNEQLLKLLSNAVNYSPVSVIITNKEGKIEYVNKAFTDINGYSFEEALQKETNLLSSGYHPKSFYDQMWSTILSGKNWTGEILNKRKNGELYWIQAIIAPILNEDGQITHFVSVREDINEKKKMFEELIVAKDKAEESSRLKTDFLQNMSHEVRTPLNAIIGFSQILDNLPELQEKHKKYTTIIKESSIKLLNIINDVIEISQISSKHSKLRLSEFDLESLIHELKNKYENQAKDKDIYFHLDLQLVKPHLIIRTDKEKLTRILEHLLDNSLKFTPVGSILLSCSQEGKKLLFSIVDSGIGIDKSMQEAIFEPFRQVESGKTRSYGGNGLGLSIVKEYISLLKGDLSLQSEINKGTKISFSIPIDDEYGTDIGQENEDAISILIAEDEESNFIYLQEILRPTRIKVIRAKNGQEALDTCRNNENISLILMDIKMPVMDGITSAKLIKEFRPDMPIVAQTAFALPSEVKQYAGIFNEYLTKPILQYQITNLINKYL